MNNLINFYIIAVDDPNDRLEFQFIPEEISINSSANIEAAATPSRNNSRFIYYGGDDSISFTLNFFAENDTATEKRELKRRVEWLRTLRYNGTDIIVTLGELFPSTPFIVESVNITYTLLDSEGQPKGATVALSLKLNPKTALTYQDTRNS